MTIQPKFHWQFQEDSGDIVRDTLSQTEGVLIKTSLSGHGRIGKAIQLAALDSRVPFDSEVSQFGTSDFTVAFGIKIFNTFNQNDTDLIGNRNTSGHGNWFSLRLEDKGKELTFEVDENNKGKHYAAAKAQNLSNLANKTWQHIAIVREKSSVKIYLNGALVSEGKSNTGIANINSGVPMNLGHHIRHTSAAQYEDLRVYYTALSPTEINDLIPPINHPLREGEIELVAADGAAVILKKDVSDLSRFSDRFQKLRSSNNTVATLYQKDGFKGTAQKCYVDLPDMRLSRLKNFPASIQIGSAVGEPFTGQQIIEMPSGQIKIADNEGQVGELAVGEVALYEHAAYHGKTWVFSDSGKELAGQHPLLKNLPGLNDRISSIRLGPDTGVTLFKHSNYRVTEGQEENEVESIFKSVPNLQESQIGNDALSSIKILRKIKPEDILISYTTKLSQDYRMVGNELEEFSAYRTTLRLKPDIGQVEVSATDLTEIEVAGKTHQIDERRSVTLQPNELNQIMITSEADGINTPGLKIRTSAMVLNERVVIFPNQAAHQQIAELEEEALWNAKDAKGNFIVDREAHSQEEVASVQNTIKQVMATVVYADESGENQPSGTQPSGTTSSVRQRSVARGRAGGTRRSVASVGTKPAVTSSSRVVSGATINRPWKIEFGAAGNTSRLLSARAVDTTSNEGTRQNLSASTPKTIIQETEISQDEFAQLLSRAIPEETTPDAPGSKPPVSTLPGQVRSIRIGKAFRKIRDAIKSGASATIGFFEDAVNILVDTAQGVFRFVVDTVEKVAEFVEAVVEKVVKSIKKFIEFLQFLFDWDDIIKTQKYLVGAVNAGLDYAALLADEAKPHVSNFFDGLQETVEDGMNNLVEKLGGDPSEVEQSKVEFPEALEWLLSKLFSGSKQSDAKTDPGTVAAPDGDSPLEEFIRYFLEAIENLIGAGLRGLEGVGDSLLTLLKDPLKPQRALIVIIEALRDVVIQLLEAGENITLGLLSAIEGVIKLFKDLLNGEIKIPFISDLFRFIGAGKLTVLNLFGLILAVPVTVVHKIAFNERPFKGDDPSELLTGPKAQITAASKPAFNQGALTRNAVTEGAVTEGDDQTAQLSSVPKLSVVRGLGAIALIANAINGFILNPYLNAVSESLDDPIESDTFRGVIELVTWLNDFFIWLPTIPGFLKVGDFGDASDEEKFLWVVRTFNLWSDLAMTIFGWTVKNPKNTQRMQRATEGTIIFSGVMSILDLMAAGRLVETFDLNQQPLNIANQALFALPNIAVMLRLVDEPNAILLLLLTDVGSAALSTVTGGFLLASDVDALKEATV